MKVIERHFQSGVVYYTVRDNSVMFESEDKVHSFTNFPELNTE